MTYTIVFSFKNNRDLKLTNVPLESLGQLKQWHQGKLKRRIFVHDGVYINLDELNLVAVQEDPSEPTQSSEGSSSQV